MAMDLVRWVLFLSYILTTLSCCLTNAQPPPFVAVYCYYGYSSRRTYTNDSTFKKNLDGLASIVSSSTVSFHNLSIGQNPDRVNVVALCRGDVATDMCRSCFINANTKLREICPKDKQSIGWYDECMLSYSDRNILNTMSTSPKAYTFNRENVSNAFSVPFNQAVRILLNDLLGAASRSTSVQKFATGKITTGPDNNTTIYALAECTPDLSGQDCRDCLNRTHEVLPKCCNGRIGGRVLYPSCNFRYEIGRFYGENTNETTSVFGPPTPTTQGNGDNNTTRNVIITVVSIIIFLLLVIACIWIFMRKRKQKKWNPLNEDENSMEISTDVESLRFDFDTIKVATDEFSDTNILGKGGFGVVYKGRLPNGRDVAVKRLSQTSDQGEVEFKNEVLSMANLQHRNLVRLLGFCLKGKERILIYEFIANGSLDQFIF
ncbi:Cysteine rich receptor like kinase, partial [Thalictrum thalictroides]